MNRGDVVRAFAELRGDAVVVMGPGGSSGLLWQAHPHPATIYNMELAYATPVALGIALGAPERRVLSFEGDGSLFAATPVLGTIARYPPANLSVIVLANGIWGTGDASIATTPHATRWPDLAVACGWNSQRVVIADALGPFRDAVRRSLSESGPWFICAVTERSSQDASGNRARPSVDAVETADLLRRYLAEKR
ncbi:MAG TPA: thiamine pyrophosphate-dependent enzyme [Candidatus Acidoferrales bacterium]|nr:thiamine pyrophosphate-dependent enzyme [Candidatus Acidoferrales bacterium]